MGYIDFFALNGMRSDYLFCSVPLSAVLAVEKLSRPQVVKKLWEYIRQHELQNPSNKKEIVCDDALRAVFAVDKIDMFRMNKVLGQYVGFMLVTIFPLTFFAGIFMRDNGSRIVRSTSACNLNTSYVSVGRDPCSSSRTMCTYIHCII